MKKHIRTLLAITSSVIFAASAVTGCGASKSSHFTTAETTAAAVARPDAGGGIDTYEYEEAQMDTAAMPMEAGMAKESAGLTSSTAIQPVSTSRKLIRTVSLHAETTDFDTLISSINQSVSDAGGYMEQSDVTGSSISDSYGRRYAYLTVRIPSDRLDQFITLVGDQANITNKSESTQDVTLQYSDIESRKKSLTIEQERLWDLLEKADTLEAVIALEERLSEIRYQLESFESQLRTYDNQVDYSTVHISIDEVKVLTPTAPDTIAERIRKGFKRSLDGVANGCINVFVWLISSLPILVVLGVVIAAVILVARFASMVFSKSWHPGIRKEKPGKRQPDSDNGQHTIKSDSDDDQKTK